MHLVGWFIWKTIKYQRITVLIRNLSLSKDPTRYGFFKISDYKYSLVEGLVAEFRVSSSTDVSVNISQEKRILEN
jgi:hypothetical protein